MNKIKQGLAGGAKYCPITMLAELIEQCPSGDEVCRSPSLSKSLVDRRQQFPSGSMVPVVVD
jgi:hypothetical protein